MNKIFFPASTWERFLVFAVICLASVFIWMFYTSQMRLDWAIQHNVLGWMIQFWPFIFVPVAFLICARGRNGREVSPRPNSAAPSGMSRKPEKWAPPPMIKYPVIPSLDSKAFWRRADADAAENVARALRRSR